MPSRELDALSRRIIAALEEDGRKTYREIGRELEIPEATVRSRVAKLLEGDYIRITTVGNPLKLGVEVVAVTLIRVKPGCAEETANILAGYPNVRFVGTSFGSADIVIQTLHPSAQKLHQFIAQEIPRAAPAIVSTETFQLAEVVKSSWAWSEWFDMEDDLKESIGN